MLQLSEGRNSEPIADWIEKRRKKASTQRVSNPRPLCQVTRRVLLHCAIISAPMRSLFNRKQGLLRPFHKSFLQEYK